MSGFRAVVRAARRDAESRKANSSRRDLISRVAALSPEALIEGMMHAFFNVELAVASAEDAEKELKYKRLSRELDRRLAKPQDASLLNWAKNSERITEIFDEMDEIYPIAGHIVLSVKYQRKAARAAQQPEVQS
jgi:hypothetical protein